MYRGGGVWEMGVPYSIRLGDLGERRELLQWVPGRKRFLVNFETQKAIQGTILTQKL